METVDKDVIVQIELRDYFAAKAMAALVTETGLMLDDFAETAYELADKMMKARDDTRRKETQTESSPSGMYGLSEDLRD